ncbi:hypothetical protein KP509_04G001100 [Ceratopteris richardii]|uniref:Homeobox domain-containing protein n=1 Tax=Ceratopteris richardii TaxID=49495 RepID=A0A8T2UPQ4_CERRI|nr:hypothetical protein KP509_04G001100 [Ceratopteris richardii]
MPFIPATMKHHAALDSTDIKGKSKNSCKDLKSRALKRSRQDVVVDSDTEEKRRGLTMEQINILEMKFKEDVELEPERKTLIAKQLGLRPRQVAIWFQNRRARWKNKQVECKYELLKAQYDAVVKEKESITMEHESILEGNRRLHSESIEKANTLGGAISPALPSCNIMSPTDSADCQSEIIMSVDVIEGAISCCHPIQEPSSRMAADVVVETEYSFYSSLDNSFSQFPMLVQQLIANGHCLQDAYDIYLGCEYFYG